MARTPAVSDDEIFEAARKVMDRRGADAFTLSDVATEVALSRAAIILRFKSTHNLKLTILKRMVDSFVHALESLPKTPSGENLIKVAAFIGAYAGSRDSSSIFFSHFSGNISDPELAALEQQRGEALYAAIACVMPETAVDHHAAVTAFRNHLTGAILSWVTSDNTEPRAYLVERTQEWLGLVGIASAGEPTDTRFNELAPQSLQSHSAQNQL